MTKPDKKRFTNIAILEETHEQLKELAEMEQRKMSTIIAEMVAERLEGSGQGQIEAQ